MVQCKNKIIIVFSIIIFLSVFIQYDYVSCETSTFGFDGMGNYYQDLTYNSLTIPSLVATKFYMPESGSLTTIHAYLKTNGSTEVCFLIYDDDFSPINFGTDTINTYNDYMWIDISVASWELESGLYWLVVSTSEDSPSNPIVEIAYVIDGSLDQSLIAYNSITPNPLEPDNYNNNLYSIYATYTISEDIEPSFFGDTSKYTLIFLVYLLFTIGFGLFAKIDGLIAGFTLATILLICVGAIEFYFALIVWIICIVYIILKIYGIGTIDK